MSDKINKNKTDNSIKINDSKIVKSNIGNKNKETKSKFNFWTMLFIPLLVTVAGGIIIWLVTK